MLIPNQPQLPIQPVNEPILCSPYEEPTAHWVYDTTTGAASQMPGRRPASYWYKTERTGSAQRDLFAEEERDDLPLVNALRDDVRRWRQAHYEGATPVTKYLLAHWTRSDRLRRLFFCQCEAVTTIIYITEILASGRRPRWTPKLPIEDYQRLCKGEPPSFVIGGQRSVFPSLVDIPNEPDLPPPLTRYGCKMATGSGKTVVMAMLIAWTFCNRGRVPGDTRFPAAVLVVCPNLTIKERLQVQMLNEGWDANNVTHILGLRAFSSQLLCEQVVGRGLRRMDYTTDPQTGRLTEEYVDVYGIPFSVIPFKGRGKDKAAPEDRPKHHVRALPERQQFEIRFPVVEGYVFALHQNAIKADVDRMEPLFVEATRTPTAVFVQPQVGYRVGLPAAGGDFAFATHDRTAYYKSIHLQTIKFEITRQVVAALTTGTGNAKPALRLQSRHQLFPQVYRLVEAYITRKVRWSECDPRELGLETYVTRIVERLVDAIEPSDTQGEPPLLPLMNRYKPVGSTAEVDFKTTRQCQGTIKSHLNQIVLDTATWERSAAFRLEQSPVVSCYARNEHLEFAIQYEYLGASHSYLPDFLVRLTNGMTLVLEIKGYEDDQDRAKHQAAQRWISSVNHWGQLGLWQFHVCRDPQMLGRELEWLMRETR